MRHSRWQGGALSGRVSRSRAMPVGGPHRENWPALQAVRVASSVGVRAETELSRRLGYAPPRPCGPLCRPEVGVPSRPRASSRLAMGVSRRCRPLCRAPLGGLPGGRGSKASSRLFSVCGARHSRWQDGASSARVSRSRAMPVGDRRSSRPGACSRSVVRGTHGGGRERHRRGFRAPARCRSETGAPAVLALVLRLWCAALTLVGWSVIGAGFAFPRDAGRRPALQRGAHAGRRERHWCWFRASARCRSETGAPAVPALVLGLWCAALTLVGWSVIGAGFALPRDAGRRPALLAVLALVLGLWCAALTLVGWSVIGAGFALPRDAGRRPALLAVPALVLGLWCAALTVAGWSVIGTGFALPRDAGLKTGAPGRARHSRWRDGALSVLVSRSRAMPV